MTELSPEPSSASHRTAKITSPWRKLKYGEIYDQAVARQHVEYVIWNFLIPHPLNSRTDGTCYAAE
jgi:hypothetical protein